MQTHAEVSDPSIVDAAEAPAPGGGQIEATNVANADAKLLYAAARHGCEGSERQGRAGPSAEFFRQIGMADNFKQPGFRRLCQAIEINPPDFK